MADASGGMETMSDATARLRAAGYVEEWVAVDGRLRCFRCGVTYEPAQVIVDEVVRFEGPSDPGDEAILFALTAPCEHRGLFSAAYGPYTSTADLAIIGALRQA